MRKLRVWNFDRLGNADGRMVEWRCFGRRRYAKKIGSSPVSGVARREG